MTPDEQREAFEKAMLEYIINNMDNVPRLGHLTNDDIKAFAQAALASLPSFTEEELEKARKKFKQEVWDTYGMDRAIAGEISHDAVNMVRALISAGAVRVK